MAAADQIKSLIKSFGESDEGRFFATAMQIAATEARQGHANFAQELKSLIDRAKKERSTAVVENKAVPFSLPKRELQELIEVFIPKIKLKDLVLNEQVRTSLYRLIEEQNKWQELKKYSLEPLRKLLLVGPPGTGKTMSAQAIAGELGLPVYIVRLDGLMSKYLGESISKLRIIFDTMQSNRAVYLFDEFDSIGARRNTGEDIGEIKRVLNSFLINIEKDLSNSIIIAASNLPESLDTALFRRFDEIITYPLPSMDELTKAFKKYLGPYVPNYYSLNYDKLCEVASGLNYSEVKKACDAVIKSMILNNKENIDIHLLEKTLTKRRIKDVRI